MSPAPPESSPANQDAPVVIVEDSLFDSTLARRAYERSSRDNPLIVLSSGSDLMHYLELVKSGDRERPELVLLDIHLEGENGLETLKKIRAHPDFRDDPTIVMLTNSDEPEDRAKAARHGADGYQVKPPSPADMVDFFNAAPRGIARPGNAN